MNNWFDIQGKHVLITGSTRGIGWILAQGFAEARAHVLVNGRNRTNVDSRVSELRQQFETKVHGYAFDVGNNAQVEKHVARIEQEIGTIDVLINNAGIHRRAPLEEMSEADWNAVLNVNVTSAFLMGQAVLAGMKARQYGKIINISSLNAEGARPTIGNYCASKAGLNALTRSMATEWGKYNIQTNAIAPGYFMTDLTKPLVENPDFDAWVKQEVPLGRWGNPEELIGTAIYLASKASDYVNGFVIRVDGGWRASL
jgi:gluconate 5-dehydrogenase